MWPCPLFTAAPSSFQFGEGSPAPAGIAVLTAPVHCGPPQLKDNGTNVNQGHEPLIVDVTNCAINASRKSRKRGSILGNILSRESNLCDQPNITEKSGSAVYREVSTKRSNDQDDDSCSVISVNSDDEIMIVEVESSSDLPPSKRQKTDIPIIDLCTPAVSKTKKKKHKNRNRNRLANGRPLSQFLPQSSNKVIKDNLHQTSKEAFKQYSSILGNSEKETSTSSSSNKSGPGYEVDNGGFHSVFGANVYNTKPTKQVGLRPIVIDGNNVAFGHSNGAYFSCKGLQFCIDYFVNRKHNVLAFVPKFRKTSGSTRDPDILDTLEREGLVSFTPSRRIGGQLIVPYDDRYIVQYAAETGGIIVSNDSYRDLVDENFLWKETIEKRLLMFTWARGVLMFPPDPLGRHGPRLEEFLRFPESTYTTQSDVCCVLIESFQCNDVRFVNISIFQAEWPWTSSDKGISLTATRQIVNRSSWVLGSICGVPLATNLLWDTAATTTAKSPAVRTKTSLLCMDMGKMQYSMRVVVPEHFRRDVTLFAFCFRTEAMICLIVTGSLTVVILVVLFYMRCRDKGVAEENMEENLQESISCPIPTIVVSPSESVQNTVHSRQSLQNTVHSTQSWSSCRYAEVLQNIFREDEEREKRSSAVKKVSFAGIYE
ncbi:hypothetical protein C0J52_09129 [Blattella germanica]|nr:hypothetical protein C0J52_09129 [Blattella germanica]